MNIQQLFESYLQNIRQRGTTRLTVDDDARLILRGWMMAARNGQRSLPASAPGMPSQVPSPPSPADEAADIPSEADSTPIPPENSPIIALPQDAGGMGLRDAVDQDQAPPSMQEMPPGMDMEDIPFFRPGGSTPAEVWQQFERLLPVWKPIQELNTLRRTAIMGQGNRQADIMFVGDAPNYYDEQKQLPFQGEAGGKLDGMLKAMGLTREQVYITHLVKFRPAMPRQTINNRPPSQKEILFSRSILDLEVRLVQPKVIVALGVIAARGLLQRGELPLAEYQANPGNFLGIPVVVSHHPSYLLRTSDLRERRRLWEEMLRVMDMAGLPITEKQRGFFLPKQARS